MSAAGVPGGKGLKSNAIGYLSNLVIAVASTAPGYSIAATLGFLVAIDGIGLQAPAVMLVAFVPMLLIAAGYYWMNRAEPDAGTSFAWVSRAMGPQLGWITGWAIIVADVIVMANLAAIAGSYTFLLFDWDSAAASTAAVTAVGCVWILLMTLICYIGIELNARSQAVLLGAEVITLGIFAVVALVKVATGDPAGSIEPSLSWISPFAIDSWSALADGLLLAVFIYWGWDSGVAVNEESRDSRHGPGRAAVVSTLCLLAIYLIVSIAAQAYGGPKLLIDNADDVLSVLGKEVFGSPLDKLLIITVLTSAAASTQTTILPTARTTLSMAAHGALPKWFGAVHARHLTPSVATWLMGIASVVWYVVLTLVSENVLADSIVALGFMIAFYYGMTGFACAIYYRRHLFDDVRTLVLVGLAPAAGGAILFALFAKALVDYGDPDNVATSLFGIGAPVVVGVGSLLLGAVLMLVTWVGMQTPFFRRRPETGDLTAVPEPAGLVG